MRKTIMAIVAAIVVGFTMSASAATAPNMTMNVEGLQSGVAVKGSKVTVTLTVGTEKIKAAEFELNYDTTKFAYNDEATQAANTSGNLVGNEKASENKAIFTYASTTGTSKFVIILDVKGTEGNAEISAVPSTLATGYREADNLEISSTTAPATQKVTVSATAPSTKPSTSGNTNNNNNTTNKKPAANTTTKKKPTKYDQTGVNVLNYVGVVGLVAAAAAGTVALKKCKNN